MAKLTKRVVDGLKVDSARDVFAWDAELRGFGVRVKPSGSKAFLVQYRNAHGQTRRMVVGKVGTLTPDEARDLARLRLAEVAKGGDPSADRQAARDAITVGEIGDWFLKEAAAGRLLGRRNRPIKASTLAADRSRIECHVRPLIGKRAVAGLTLADCEAMQADIAAGKTKAARRERGRGAVSAGGTAVAGRTLAMLHSIFAHAVHKRLIPTNPAAGSRKLKGRKRIARLSFDQLGMLGKTMTAVAPEENCTGLAAIRLLLLTGFRRHEVLAIKPSWIMDAGGVAFPDTKSDAQVRPVGRAAMAVLKAQRKLVGDGEWLFPADRGDGHFIGVRKVLGRVAKAAGLTGVTPHVLRHTFGSVAGDLGYSELTIAGLLGHAGKSVTSGYVHLDHALVAAADRVSSVIAAALDGIDGADIIKLDERRAST